MLGSPRPTSLTTEASVVAEMARPTTADHHLYPIEMMATETKRNLVIAKPARTDMTRIYHTGIITEKI